MRKQVTPETRGSPGPHWCSGVESYSVSKSQSRGPTQKDHAPLWFWNSPHEVHPYQGGACTIFRVPRGQAHTAHASLAGPQSPLWSCPQHRELRLPAFLGKAPHSPISPFCFLPPGSSRLSLAFSSGGSCGDRSALVAPRRCSSSSGCHLSGRPSQGASVWC